MFSYEYPRPSLTVDSIVIREINNEQSILLIKRKHDPYANAWAFPGGFVEMDELLETAAIRELEEETGIKLNSLIQFRAYDELNRDPRGRTISIVFYRFINYDPIIIAQDDAMDIGWFPIKEVPNLAFDHARIINEFYEDVLVLSIKNRSS